LSAGDGLLEHNRAHLRWLDGVLERHPELILENCASGAMRADFAMLERMQLQSTSDQQDYLRYPSIAAAAPLAMLPEQAANWAYPQADMSPESINYCLVTGLVGRFYLSGRLDLMSSQQLSWVSQALDFARRFGPDLVSAVPFWPIGIPRWEDPWVALGLATDRGRLIAVWNRDPAVESPELPVQALQQVFPDHLPGWRIEPTDDRKTLRIANPTGEAGARLFTLREEG
jgi:alpha-galactosidase